LAVRQEWNDLTVLILMSIWQLFPRKQFEYFRMVMTNIKTILKNYTSIVFATFWHFYTATCFDKQVNNFYNRARQVWRYQRDNFKSYIEEWQTMPWPNVCLFVWWCLTPLSIYFSYIVRVSFIGGGNRRTRRKPPTCRKSLINVRACCKCA
jgi:hypothetical protein